ncbi:TonB family protein [Fulvivirga lutimaris]|uniref:TonB family protein n=1 Tax=Fulvivirga lutimaris TaxID=1819566 RepID=UPI0012BCB798|nr:TonB family protein [Fulvivirga lutimaris]
MSKDKKHIDQLTPELIDKYYKGLLSEDEQHQIERLMLNSSFENEAMEGFDRYEGDLLNDLNKINTQLEERISKEKNDNIFFYIKIAASILLLALSTYLVHDIAKDTNKPQIAQNEPVQTPEESFEEELSLEKEIDDTEAESVPEPAIEKNQPPEEKVVETRSKEIENTDSNIESDQLIADNAIIADEKEVKSESMEIAEIDVADDEVVAEEFISEELVTVESTKEETARPIEARKKSVARSAARDEAPSAAGLAMTAPPSTSTISGKVTSIEDGQPLPGVNVVVKGTTKGAVTGIDGRFKIDDIEASEKDALVISFIGLATKEVEIGDRSQIDVQMGSDVSQLSEVVVVGYGTSSTAVDNSINTWNNSRPSISMSDYKDYLRENTKYDSAQQVKGKVAVKFDILENGQLTNFEIKRSLSDYYDQEAIRLIKEGPEWLPAEQNGNKVKSTARVTVKFDNE